MKTLILILLSLFTSAANAREYSKSTAAQCSYHVDEYANNTLPAIDLPQMGIEISSHAGTLLIGQIDAIDIEVRPGLFINVKGHVIGNGHKWMKQGNELMLSAELYKNVDGHKFSIDQEGSSSNEVSNPKELEAAKTEVATSLSLQDLTYENLNNRGDAVPRDLVTRVNVQCKLVKIN